MTRILNGILNILKILLLLVSFGLTFYVIMFMYKRLEKSYLDALEVFAPFLILLFILLINMAFGQKQVTSNLFYNITSCLVFATLIFVAYRAITDDYMVMGAKMGYDISFNYFSDIVAPMKSMLYLLIFSNILLLFSKEKDKEKEKVMETPKKVKKTKKLD